jgi:hypothetical protein
MLQIVFFESKNLSRVKKYDSLPGHIPYERNFQKWLFAGDVVMMKSYTKREMGVYNPEKALDFIKKEKGNI